MKITCPTCGFEHRKPLLGVNARNAASLAALHAEWDKRAERIRAAVAATLTAEEREALEWLVRYLNEGATPAVLLRGSIERRALAVLDKLLGEVRK